MRAVVLVLSLVVLGATLWVLLGGDPRPAPEPRVSDEQGDPEAPASLRHRAGTLTFRVRAPDGSVPPGAQVGYETPKGARLYYVDAATGTRTLSDAPLGEVMLLAQAPGFALIRRPTRITGGLTEELLFNLVPTPLGPTGPSPVVPR